MKSIWLSQIARNPLDYIGYRLSAFSYLLRSPNDGPYYIWHSGIDENQLGIKQEKNGMTLLVDWFVHKSAKLTPFAFKPYWWLWIGSLLLLMTFTIKSNSSTRTVQALLMSSVLYILGYLPVTPMADFRYIYWSVIATTLAITLLIIDRPVFFNCSAIKKATLVLFAILISALILNLNKMVPVNMDVVLSESLPGNWQPVAAIPQHHYLTRDDQGYSITGNDPQLIYDISDRRLKPQDVRFLGFDFLCSDQQSKPSLQIFWWGDNQSGPSEKQSLVVGVNEGANVIHLSSVAEWASMHEISGLRIDLVEPSSCRAIKLVGLSLYK